MDHQEDRHEKKAAEDEHHREALETAEIAGARGGHHQNGGEHDAECLGDAEIIERQGYADELGDDGQRIEEKKINDAEGAPELAEAFEDEAGMADAGHRAETFDIRPPEPSAPVAQMSGGNQQKIVLAKWMEPRPRVLLLHEPTQGVDVGARVEIRSLVTDACHDRGMGVVWVTTDFEELAEMCDRVLVFADGQVVTQLSGDQVTKPAIDEAVIRTSSRG